MVLLMLVALDEYSYQRNQVAHQLLTPLLEELDKYSYQRNQVAHQLLTPLLKALK